MKRTIDQRIPRLLTGLMAMALLAWLSLTHAGDDRAPLIFLASLFLFPICLTDTLRARIPNPLTLALALAGTGYQWLAAGPAGLLAAGLGLLTGLLLLILPFALGGMGGGDVKALAALGTLLGPAATFQVFLYMGLMGGVLALFHYLLAATLRERLAAWGLALKTLAFTGDPRALLPDRTTEKLRFPYAAAIVFGFFAHLEWGRLL